MHLQQWLELRKVKPTHFARLINEHVSAVTRLAKGQRDPTFVQVRKIDKATSGQVGLWDWPEPKGRG